MAGAGNGNYVFITIAALNMIISLYYYLKVVKVMFMDENDHPIENLKTEVIPAIALVVCVAGIIIVGFASDIFNYIYSISFGL